MRIGIDHVIHERFKDKENSPIFMNRVLHDSERAYYATLTDEGRKLEFLASRFALKEALYKAGLTIHFNEMEIGKTADGAPIVVGHPEYVISVSHEANTSIAIAIYNPNK